MNLATAIAITAEAFKTTTDKGGQPYILHCLRVMHDSPGDDDVKCAAVMHDLVEDGHFTLEQLSKLGFSADVIYYLEKLTHTRDKESYDEYIKRVATCPETTIIKQADLRDNSNITRMKGLRKKDFDRLEKYHRAYMYLSND